jgi:hypothetical protein
MADRFDFENMVMRCWNVTDDIKTISTFVGASHMLAAEQDKLLNMLIGVETLYNERFHTLMHMFSAMVRDGVITNTRFTSE